MKKANPYVFSVSTVLGVLASFAAIGGAATSARAANDQGSWARKCVGKISSLSFNKKTIPPVRVSMSDIRFVWIKADKTAKPVVVRDSEAGKDDTILVGAFVVDRGKRYFMNPRLRSVQIMCRPGAKHPDCVADERSNDAATRRAGFELASGCNRDRGFEDRHIALKCNSHLDQLRDLVGEGTLSRVRPRSTREAAQLRCLGMFAGYAVVQSAPGTRTKICSTGICDPLQGLLSEWSGDEGTGSIEPTTDNLIRKTWRGGPGAYPRDVFWRLVREFERANAVAP